MKTISELASCFSVAEVVSDLIYYTTAVCEMKPQYHLSVIGVFINLNSWKFEIAQTSFLCAAAFIFVEMQSQPSSTLFSDRFLIIRDLNDVGRF